MTNARDYIDSFNESDEKPHILWSILTLLFFVMVVATPMASYVGYKIDGWFLAAAVGVSWFLFFFIGFLFLGDKAGK